MSTRLLRWVISASSLAWPLSAQAQIAGPPQPENTITPSLSAGMLYDENILWRPNAQSDHVWRVTPGVSFVRTTPRAEAHGQFSSESEWLSRHRDLSTAVARQHGDFLGTWQLTPVAQMALRSDYDNSVIPAELNVATGLALGRVRGWRWSGGPEASYAITPALKATLRYQLTGEFSSIETSVFTNELEARLAEKVSQRTELRVRYLPDVYRFQGTTLVSHGGTVGVTRTHSSATRVALDAGVRVIDAHVRPEIDAGAWRQTSVSNASVEYVWTHTTAVGLTELVDVQRITGIAGYQYPNVIAVSLRGALYHNRVGVSTVDVLSSGLEIVRRIAGPISIAASYSVDYQRGGVAGVILPDVGTVGPPVLITPAERVHRNLLFVRFVLSSVVQTAARPEPPSGPGSELPAGSSHANR